MTWGSGSAGSLFGETAASGGGYTNQGGLLDNTGTINVPAAGGPTVYDSVGIKNEATFDFTGDTTIVDGNDSPTFTNTNTGLVEKTGGVGIASFGMPFNNLGGTVSSISGTLSPGYGTNTGGFYTAGAGATVAMAGVITGSYTGSGAGTVTLGGNLQVGTGGATFTFPSGLFLWTQYDLNLDGKTLTNAGFMTWDVNAATGSDGISANTGVLNNGYSNQQGTLDNTGKVIISGGVVYLYDSVTVQNDGTLDFTGTASIVTGDDSPSFINTATGLIEQTGAGTGSSITTPFNNQAGTLDAASGTLSLGYGTNTGGNYNASIGATLDISGVMTGNYTGGGGGTVSLGGNIQIGSGGATFNFPAGMFVWNSNYLNLDGHTLTNTGFMTWDLNVGAASTTQFGIDANTGVLNNGYSNQGGTLNNSGTVIVPAGTVYLYDSVAISNLGLFNFTGDAAVSLGNDSPAFTNTGLIEKTGGITSSSITVTFNNQLGTVFASTGTLSFGYGTNTGGTYNAAAGATVAVSGTLTGTYTGSGGGTFTLDGNIILGSGGATFDFPAGYFVWTIGAINLDSQTLVNAGAMTWNVNVGGGANGIDGNSNIDGNGYSNQGGTLDNKGTITIPAGGPDFYDSVRLLNESILNFTGDSSIVFYNDSPSVVNTAVGVISKLGGTGTSSIGPTFVNQGGTLYAASGTLSVVNNPNDGVSSLVGATFNTAAGATVAFNGYITGTLTGIGSGTVTLGGNIMLGSGGATFNFPSGMFVWTAYGIDLDSQTLINANSMTWDVNVGGGTATIFGNSAIGGNGYSNQGGTLDNRGTITIPAGGPELYDSVQLLNESVFNFTGDSSLIYGNDSPTFVNTSLGIAEKTGGSGVSLISPGIAFNSQGGTASADVGTFNLGTGTSTGATFNASPGAGLLFSGYLTGTYTGAGGGSVGLNGNVLLGSGVATFNFPAGLFQWTTGNIDLDAQTLNNIGSMTWETASSTLFGNSAIGGNGYSNQGGTFNNSGSVLIASGSVAMYDSVQIRNTGTINFNGDGSIIDGNDSPSVVNVVGGLIEKTGGVSNSSIGVPVSSLGTVQAGAATLFLSGGVSQITGTTLTAGTWAAINGATLNMPTGTNIVTNQATLQLAGSNATITGITNLASNSGTFGISGGATFNTSGNVVNTGTVSLGAGGTVNVVGSFTEGPAATLAIGLGGTSASKNFGMISVTGQATLAGTLSAALSGSFTPSGTDSYTIEKFTSYNGSFGTETFPTLPGVTFSALINPGSVVLTTVAIVPSSTVAALPASEATPTFILNWSGSPYPGGPAVATYSVYVSTNGGAFVPFVTNTSSTSGSFIGAYGQTYGFYSIATDIAGHVQPTPGMAQATTTVVNAPIVVAPTPVNAVAGRAFSGQVASFTDSDPTLTSPSSFNAVITWGDGHMTAGIVTAGVGGAFVVSGSNTYVTGGTDTLSITVTDSKNITGTASETANVAAGNLTVVSTTTLTTVAGVQLTNVVLGTFNDSGGVQLAGAYTATINWNDGTLASAGTVSIVAGKVVVSGTHLYPKNGTFAPLITLSDAASSTTASAAVTVINPLAITVVTTISPARAVAFSGVVANLTDANVAEISGQFTATITWGDGHTSAGTVSGSNGVFTVTGTNTYAAAGPYTVSVAITDTGGNTASASGGITVVETYQPTLVVAAPTLPTTLAAGATLSFTYTVTNTGNAAATAPWTDEIILSPSSSLADPNAVVLATYTHAASLAVGANYQQLVSAALPYGLAGSYTVFIVIDSGNAVAQGSRSGDVTTAPLTVTASTPADGSGGRGGDRAGDGGFRRHHHGGLARGQPGHDHHDGNHLDR